MTLAWKFPVCILCLAACLIWLSFPNSRSKQSTSEMSARKSYSLSFNLKVIDDVKEGVSKHRAALKYGVHRKKVEEWCLKEQSVRTLKGNNVSSRKRPKGGGRKVKYQDIEDDLMTWFHDRREKGVRVTGKELKHEALRLHKIKGNQSFKGSCMWFRRFRNRHHISFRRATHIAQKSRTIIGARVDRLLKIVIRLKELRLC